MSNIFEDKTRTIPRNDSRIVRVEFDKSDIGARKTHLSEIAAGRSDMSIVHVKGTR